MDYAKSRKQLEEEEGREHYVYPDSKHLWTIGVGRLVDARVRGGGLSDAEIDYLLSNDISAKWSEIIARAPWVAVLDDARQFVILSLAFQCGTDGLFEFKFFLAAMERGDWYRASQELLDSDLAREDAPERARRLAQQVLTGEWVSKGQKA